MFRSAAKTVIGFILLFPLALLAMAKMGHSPMSAIDNVINQFPVELVSWTGLRKSEPVVIGQWPPQVGAAYPDLILEDQNGDEVRLSEFAGKVILVELAAVPCKGCQAFAGGEQRGGFAGVEVQPGLKSIHHYAEQFAGTKLGGENVVFVQLLLYGQSRTSPTREEVNGWAQHFGMDRNQNQIVLRGDPSMLSRESYEMIPGFHLIDRSFILRSDSSGHHPSKNLYEDLLPKLGELANR